MSPGQFLVVFASPGDPAPQHLDAACPGRVLRLTCADLSKRGWRLRLSKPAEGRAVISGDVVCVTDIAGVVVRKGWVTEEDMPQIAGEDRYFVAAEAHAFLLAFFSSLPCPVWNPPTPSSLGGPYLRPLQWKRLAMECGLDVSEASALRGTWDEAPDHVVTVVGESCFGAPGGAWATAAHRLAVAAEAPLLSVGFATARSGPRFLSADPWPNLGGPGVAAAVVAALAPA